MKQSNNIVYGITLLQALSDILIALSMFIENNLLLSIL